MAVLEIGQIEGEATDVVDAGGFGVEDGVHQVERFEGDGPVSCFVHAVGDGPEDGLQVEVREADPFADTLGVAAVEGGLAVARGADHGFLNVRVAESAAAREVGLPEAVSILECAGGSFPQPHFPVAVGDAAFLFSIVSCCFSSDDDFGCENEEGNMFCG